MILSVYMNQMLLYIKQKRKEQMIAVLKKNSDIYTAIKLPPTLLETMQDKNNSQNLF